MNAFSNDPSYRVTIDPGLSGAISFIDTVNLTLEIFDLPQFEVTRNGKNKTEVNCVALGDIFAPRAKFITGVTIEQVGAMPGQGVTSMFNFGMGYGIYHGVIGVLKIPLTKASPATWKKAMQLNSSKDASLIRATELMPRCAVLWPLKKHEGRAESALLGLYGLGLKGKSVGSKLQPIVKSAMAA